MSLFKEAARPCRATRRYTRGFQHVRVFSASRSIAAPTREEVQGAHQYCVALLSKYDRPSYTLSTFIPPHARSFYLALRALNVSLSTIPDTTSSPTIGLMRLQFWRDAVNKILAGSPPKEPVAILMAAAISELHERTQGRARISKGWLTRIINTREQTLTNDPYPNIAALESYAENTYSTLMYLTLAALPMTSVTADHVASHIGKAVGIAAVLRGLPLLAFPAPTSQAPSGEGAASLGLSGGARQGAVMLPLDVMAQAGVKEEEVLRKGAEADGLRDAVFTVATRANDHLITVEEMLSNLRAGEDVGHDFEHEGEEGHEYNSVGSARGEAPLDEIHRAFGVFLPAVGTRLWLDRLQQFDFDVFRPELLQGDWKLPWKAYLAYQRKRL